MEPGKRLERFLAQIIDTALYAAPYALLKLFSLPVFGLFFGAILLIVIQIWMLTTRGQTFGKQAMGLRIVRLADQSNGGFFTNVLLRSVPIWLIASIPVIGQICFLIDALFIFREDRRCLHDIVAGTYVIKT